MDIEAIRSGVQAAVAAVAPECDVRGLARDRSLREQVDLDSMDWINLIAGLQERLKVDIPESDQSRLATLDSIVSYIASRLAGSETALRVTSPREAAPLARRLPDGTVITLRPLRPGDAQLDADLVRHLSGESRYKRFMATLRELPAQKLDYLTHVDGVNRVALIATVRREGREAPLGVARYDVDATGTNCEFAIAVDDAWHGSGVAGLLMHALIDMARSRGLTRMEGTILAANRKMLKFARQLGFELKHELGDYQTVHAVRRL